MTTQGRTQDRNIRDLSALSPPTHQKQPAENGVGFCFPVSVLRRVGLLCPLLFQCKSFSFLVYVHKRLLLHSLARHGAAGCYHAPVPRGIPKLIAAPGAFQERLEALKTRWSQASLTSFITTSRADHGRSPHARAPVHQHTSPPSGQRRWRRPCAPASPPGDTLPAPSTAPEPFPWSQQGGHSSSLPGVPHQGHGQPPTTSTREAAPAHRHLPHLPHQPPTVSVPLLLCKHPAGT